MIYMQNPSEPPKRKRKSKRKKSRMRRNPELLIVNPYSPDEDGNGKEKTMAKRKSRKRKMSRRRRKNPVGGFDIKKTAFTILGADPATGELDYHNVKRAVMAAAGGGLALGVATAALGKHVETGTNMGKAIVALAAGVGGGVALHGIAEATDSDMLKELAVAGAFGAMVLGGWQLVQPFVEPAAETFSQKIGLAGWLGEEGISTYTSDVAGWSPYGAFVEETVPGLGQTVTAWTEADTDALMAEQAGLGSYEPLGDIYNSQRLGSFEGEGLGKFVVEPTDALMYQQDKDTAAAQIAKKKAGGFAGYELAGEGAAVIGGPDAAWGPTIF